jgi:hypothetical protein
MYSGMTSFGNNLRYKYISLGTLLKQTDSHCLRQWVAGISRCTSNYVHDDLLVQLRSMILGQIFTLVYTLRRQRKREDNTIVKFHDTMLTYIHGNLIIKTE